MSAFHSKTIILASFVGILLLASCATPPNPASPLVAEPNANPEGNPGMPCASDNECVTPATYLVRSTCPFTSWCVEGRCAVICPMMLDRQNEQRDGLEFQVCKTTADCDCTRFAAMDGGTCSCIEETCAVIMKNDAE